MTIPTTKTFAANEAMKMAATHRSWNTHQLKLVEAGAWFDKASASRLYTEDQLAAMETRKGMGGTQYQTTQPELVFFPLSTVLDNHGGSAARDAGLQTVTDGEEIFIAGFGRHTVHAPKYNDFWELRRIQG